MQIQLKRRWGTVRHASGHGRLRHFGHCAWHRSAAPPLSLRMRGWPQLFTHFEIVWRCRFLVSLSILIGRFVLASSRQGNWFTTCIMITSGICGPRHCIFLFCLWWIIFWRPHFSTMLRFCLCDFSSRCRCSFGHGNLPLTYVVILILTAGSDGFQGSAF